MRLSMLASLGAISGCASSNQQLSIAGVKGSLPKEWIKRLPHPWRFEIIKPEGSELSFQKYLNKSNLIILDDGWLPSIDFELISDFDLGPFLQEFDYQAISFLNGLGEKDKMKVFPVGVSPWVMLFRNGDPWFDKASKSWDVLLDKGLKNSIVLPESPRLIISIAERMSDPEALRKLRDQCEIYDDRNALNWVLSGHASTAVLPLRRCWSLLSQDSRLRTVIPSSGAPLNWTVLIKSNQSDLFTFPKDWIKESMKLPLIKFLLARGWLPPISIDLLRDSSDFELKKNGSILLPSNEIWRKCWSLPILDNLELYRLEKIWRESS